VITDLHTEGFLEFSGQRHQRLAEIGRRPPAAGDDAVVRSQLGCPGEVLLAGAKVSSPLRAERRLSTAWPLMPVSRPRIIGSTRVVRAPCA